MSICPTACARWWPKARRRSRARPYSPTSARLIADARSGWGSRISRRKPAPDLIRDRYRYAGKEPARICVTAKPWRRAAEAPIFTAMPSNSFPPFDPDRPERGDRLRFRRRFRPIPVRTLVPNLITLLALCAGLTSIRFAIEGRLDIALAAIVFAAVLDGIDGRVARLLRGTSRFGAELDSLADFVNFGVAPGLILYFWDLG